MSFKMGINLNNSSFWENGIKYLSDKIKELIKLVETCYSFRLLPPLNIQDDEIEFLKKKMIRIFDSI